MLQEALAKLAFTLEGLKDENNITTNALSIGFVVCIAVYWWMTRRNYNLPPGPRGLPVLGYLPFLGNEPHKAFYNLSKKYGNVFGLYLGQTYVVVLGDYESVKEELSQIALLSRPTSHFDFAPDGFGFGTAQATEWVEQRRFTVRAMRDIGLGGSKWETLIQEEVDDILKVIQSHNGEPTDFSKLLSESISNNITTLIFGKRFPIGDPARRHVDNVVEAAIDATDVGNLRNFFPVVADFLANFGVLVSQKKDMHQMFAEFTDFLKKQVDERKTVYKDEDSGIFIDGYLKEMDKNVKNQLNNTFTDRNLRGTVMALLTGATDTTTASVMWLLIAMVKYPEVQAKVHRELDAVLGKEGQPKYTERSKLPYTYAVLQECGRWKTIVPVNVVRQAMEDIKIQGYDVPKDTLVLSNLWAIHTSPKYWKEPEKFVPERFLTNDGLPNMSKLDGYIPFSHGKRNCPGETVAKITIFLYFAAIMQRFKVLPPVGKAPKLEGRPGLTFRPVKQELRIVMRE